jgi:hypothetical protein
MKMLQQSCLALKQLAEQIQAVDSLAVSPNDVRADGKGERHAPASFIQLSCSKACDAERSVIYWLPASIAAPTP